MTGNCNTVGELDNLIEDFAADLTSVAYAVALRYGVKDRWLDLQLELWTAMMETAKKWGQQSHQLFEESFTCDWA